MIIRPGDLVRTLGTDCISLRIRPHPGNTAYRGHVGPHDGAIVIAVMSVINVMGDERHTHQMALLMVMGNGGLGWVYCDHLTVVDGPDGPITEEERCNDPLLRSRVVI